MKATHSFLRLAMFIVALTAYQFSCSPPKDQKSGGADSTATSEGSPLGDDPASQALLAINASQFGVAYPETFILLQNRMGIRIEYCVDRSRLQLWISPQAGKSFSYKDKNWSNRDDFTAVFDRILIPGLNLNDFDSCKWDPFHSIIYFKNQTLHLSQVYDQPAVLVWFDKDGEVDLKIFGDVVERKANAFVVNHESRGRDFQSAAILGKGEGYFQHQLDLDEGRSTHARAHMKPGQFLVIASELKKENIQTIARKVADTDLNTILADNETKIAADLANGQFTLKNKPEMQKLLNISRRVAISMQDFKGFMRSTNQYIYYLLWYRDGGMNTSHICYSGWTQPAYDQAKFTLLNPNTSTTEPKGKYYGQVMGGPITKWEEDGLFYVIWPAFAYWTQTGDDTFLKGEYLKTMEEAMDWLERYCYDEEKGLFGRYYYCETPLTDSRDDGWDNATGAPSPKWGSDYKGKTIVRSYDAYINLINYANYMMLSMMEKGPKAEVYYQKALSLEANMKHFFDYKGNLPSYGDLITKDGSTMVADPYGLDIWDYVWGLALPPFTPTMPEKYKALREQIFKDMTTTKNRYFICVYNALLTSMDTEIHSEDSIMSALEKLMPESVRPGKYLPMPYSVPELINVNDGDPFHDVRPLVYSIAPWLSAVTNLGLRRMPFGVAVRGTKYLEKIDNYEFRGALLDISYQGEGTVSAVTINGTPLNGSLQIPENMLRQGENAVEVKMDKNAKPANQLASSTLRLISAENGIFEMEAFGKNVLMFKNLNRKVRITDAAGAEIKPVETKMDNLTWLEFPGRGTVSVSLN